MWARMPQLWVGRCRKTRFKKSLKRSLACSGGTSTLKSAKKRSRTSSRASSVDKGESDARIVPLKEMRTIAISGESTVSLKGVNVDRRASSRERKQSMPSPYATGTRYTSQRIEEVCVWPPPRHHPWKCSMYARGGVWIPVVGTICSRRRMQFPSWRQPTHLGDEAQQLLMHT